MMGDSPNPFLHINFDETGFSRHLGKGKYKIAYISKTSHIKPFWGEQADIHHIF